MSQYDPEPRPRSIPNHLTEAILVTICCCVPFGIVAIVYAAQVNGKLQAGDVAGAQDSADKAKMWCWIGFGLGLVVNIISVIVQVALMQQGGGFR
jgi:interferon-induced transmembrane protein